MKRSIITLATMSILTMATWGTNPKCNNSMNTERINCESSCYKATCDEIAGICKALDLYCEASVKGDSKVARPAFAPTATMSFAENGKLVSMPIQALFDYYDQTGPQPASYKITSCTVATDVAIVSISSQFGDTCFDDMFTLVKDGNDWKIISKIYHAN